MDIQLKDYVIRQREDGMYNASYLLNQVNEKKSEKTPMIAYMRKQSTKNLINGLSENSVFIEKMKSNGRPFDITWFSPYLFIDFVLWLEPSIYEDVYMLVARRIAYKIIIERDCEKIENIASAYAGYDVSRVIKGINYAAIGKVNDHIDYYASDDDLNAVIELMEQLYTEMINGTITNFDLLLKFFKKNHK